MGLCSTRRRCASYVPIFSRDRAGHGERAPRGSRVVLPTGPCLDRQKWEGHCLPTIPGRPADRRRILVLIGAKGSTRWPRRCPSTMHRRPSRCSTRPSVSTAALGGGGTQRRCWRLARRGDDGWFRGRRLSGTANAGGRMGMRAARKGTRHDDQCGADKGLLDRGRIQIRDPKAPIHDQALYFLGVNDLPVGGGFHCPAIRRRGIDESGLERVSPVL